jgi:Phosphotransferase system, mannose/fructose-specific component IIA
MIGILLVTHGALSEGMADSIALIVGQSEKLATMTLKQSDNVVTFKEKVGCKLKELNDGDGVLVLVDMLGGSPYNVVAASLGEEHVECITGLNLPMVLEALDSRTSNSLEKVVDICMQSAKKGIINVRKHVCI